MGKSFYNELERFFFLPRMTRRKIFQSKLPMSWHFPYVQARKSAESEKPGTEIKRKQPSLLDMYWSDVPARGF